MPGTKAIVVRQSQRLRKPIRVTSKSGVDWVMTDVVPRMKVRTTAPSVVVLLDASAMFSVDPDDEHRLILDLSEATTADLPVGDHRYDLFLDGVPVLAGDFVVEPAVSR